MSSNIPKNPFILAGYYGKSYFCDREQEMQVLLDHAENGRNVVLYSWRRMGKTALIQFFIKTMEENEDAEVIYVDLLPTNNVHEATEQITQATYERFGKTSTGFTAAFQKLLGSVGAELSFDPVTGIPSIGIGVRKTGAQESSLKAIGEFLASRDKQIIVALDEFQQVSKYPDQNGEAVVRSWLQSFPQIRFIFCGSHRHLMTSMFTEKNRPFYRSSQLIALGPIPQEKYGQFIQKHFSKESLKLPDEVLEQIFSWSRGQTYCIQLICNKLFGLKKNITFHDFQQVVHEILEQETPVFYNYANLLTQTQWQVLKAVAREEPLTNPLSRGFINKYRLGAASSVNTALNMLMRNEMIIREENQYLLHDVLLTRWLQSR